MDTVTDGHAPDTGLSHLDSDGRARMVDVSGKPETNRRATASAHYRTRPDVVALLRDNRLPKADVFTTARLAGIAAAKRTSDLIPLCHPLPLDALAIDLDLIESGVLITATATTTGRTGVEMEALTAAAVAGLTLHDMIKAVDPRGTLTDVRLLTKTGGKTGPWHRDDEPAAIAPPLSPRIRPRSAAVIVASTRAAHGERADETGPVIDAWLIQHGFSVDGVTVVADADLASALRRALATHPAVILTTGGTGISPSDHTPEVVRAVLDAELPGIAEAIRARGLETTPTAALSRGVAGVAGGTVIVALPGSHGGVLDGLHVLDGLLAHLIDQVAGGDHA